MSKYILYMFFTRLDSEYSLLFYSSSRIWKYVIILVLKTKDLNKILLGCQL